MNTKDLIGCVVPPQALAGCGGTPVPGYPEPLPARSNPARAISLRPHRVVCQCGTVCELSAIPCSFVRRDAIHLLAIASTCTTHNAPIPPSRRLGQPHCVGPHCMTLSSITLHRTTHRAHLAGLLFPRLSIRCLSSQSVSLVSAVVSPISARLCLPSVP